MNRIVRAWNTAQVAARGAFESRVPFWPLARIEWLQRRRVRAIVRHAYASVPFYRDAMRARGLRPSDFRTASDLEKLPLLDSLIVREQLDAFFSSAVDDRSRLEFHTSGTHSGAQKLVYWDHFSALKLLTHGQRDLPILRRLLKRTWGQDQLFILPLDSSTMLLRQFWDSHLLAPRRLANRHFVNHLEPFETVLERMNAIRPQIVMSYGSYAEQFFRTLSERWLNAALPQVWSYGSDSMDPGVREWIERTYGCQIVTVYGSVESGRLGWECERRQGFHLNVDQCAVRLVDDEGRTVPPGQLGEVVVSNLYNRATVLLNMRLDDLGVLDPNPCHCGRSLPLLSSFEGRTSELIQTTADRRLPARIVFTALHDDLRGTLINQLVHPRAGEIRWRVVPATGIDRTAFAANLIARSRELLDPELRVTVEFVDAIERTRAGKLRRVVRVSERLPGNDADTGA